MVATHRDNIDSCRVALDGVTRCSLEVGRNWRISLINLVDETFVDRLLLFERNVRIINKQESWDDEAERGEAETRAFREIVTVQWKYFPQSGKSSFDYLSLSLSPSLCLYAYAYCCYHFTSIFSLRQNVFFFLHLRNYRAFRLGIASINFFIDEDISIRIRFFFSFSFFSNLQTVETPNCSIIFSLRNTSGRHVGRYFARVNIEMKTEREREGRKKEERKEREKKRVHDIIDESVTFRMEKTHHTTDSQTTRYNF